MGWSRGDSEIQRFKGDAVTKDENEDLKYRMTAGVRDATEFKPTGHTCDSSFFVGSEGKKKSRFYVHSFT